MAWLDTHSITDLPCAYRATRAGLLGDENLAMVDADLSTVATAEAAAVANATANSAYVGERYFGINTARGFRAAYDQGFTFGSTFTAFFASGPANTQGNKAIFVSGS